MTLEEADMKRKEFPKIESDLKDKQEQLTLFKNVKDAQPLKQRSIFILAHTLLHIMSSKDHI